MNDYIPEDHPDRYKDLDILEKPERSHMGDADKVLCPVCDGHGGWNLRIDAYGEGKHFQAMCSQCNGWGWVIKDSDDASCVHDMEEMSREWCAQKNVYHAGMCYHVQKCKKCGKVSAYDSSG